MYEKIENQVFSSIKL